jgi:hypothetical protein
MRTERYEYAGLVGVAVTISSGKSSPNRDRAIGAPRLPCHPRDGQALRQPQVHHERAHRPGGTDLPLVPIIAFPAQAGIHRRHGHRPSPVWFAVGHGRSVAIHQGESLRTPRVCTCKRPSGRCGSSGFWFACRREHATPSPSPLVTKFDGSYAFVSATAVNEWMDPVHTRRCGNIRWLTPLVIVTGQAHYTTASGYLVEGRERSDPRAHCRCDIPPFLKVGMQEFHPVLSALCLAK